MYNIKAHSLLVHILHISQLPMPDVRVPVSASHVAIGEYNQELAKQNLRILAILAK